MRKQPKLKRFINPLCCAKCKVNQAAVDEYAFALKWNATAAELNMSAYEDARMHARTNHKLLTEAKEEIERLRRKVQTLEQDRLTTTDWEKVADGRLVVMNRQLQEIAQLESEVLRQQNLLKHWGRFDVVSSRLEGDHA